MFNYKVEFTLCLNIQYNKKATELYEKLYKAFLNFEEVNGAIVNYYGNLVVTEIIQNIETYTPNNLIYAIITLTNENVSNKKYPEKVHEVCLNCGSQFITEEYEYIVMPKLISRCVNCLN